MQSQVNEEALEHYEAYAKMYYGAASVEEQQDPNLLRECATELKLAIKKAKGSFPKAQAALSYVFFLMQDYKSAATEARIALEQDEHNSRARLVKVLLSLDNYSESGGIQSADLGGCISFLFGSAKASSRQNAIKNEIDMYVKSFRYNAQNRTDAGLWLTMSDDLMAIADMIDHFKLKLPGGRPNLYEEILKIPWDKLPSGEYNDAIAKIRRKAEGRSLLHKK